jgi:hypothetical protein
MDCLRSLRLLAAVASAGAFSASLPAQSAPNPILAPATPAPKVEAAPRHRAISSDVASQLAGAMPKYTPPPPKPAPKPEDEEVDAREIDKPRNGIIRLPKIIVNEPRPPIFTERAVSTEKGIRDIAVRRYISEVDRAMNRFTLPLFGSSIEARAMAMYAEQERLDNIDAMKDAASTVGKSDPTQGAYIRKEAQKTFMRAGDFGWQGGGAPK